MVVYGNSCKASFQFQSGKELRTSLANIANDLPDAEVKRLMAGVYMVALHSHSVGCAYTWREMEAAAHLCCEIEGAGKIRGASVKTIVQRLKSEAPLERSVGMAALNSMINTQSSEWQHGDILAYMGKRFAGAKVAMIGHFPFAPEIKKWAGEFHIIEKRPVEDDLNEEAGFDWLSKCDVAIITGVTLLNDSLPGILKAAPQAWKMMLGPTVPMHRILLDAGINALTGIISQDPDIYWQSIEEGAIVPRYQGCISAVLSDEKLNLPAGDFRQRLCKMLDQKKIKSSAKLS